MPDSSPVYVGKPVSTEKSVTPYGHHWRTVTRPAILRRAGGVFDELGRYQGGARCVRCGVPDIFPLSIWQRSTLDCAHLDGDPTNDAEENTAALCRACHRSLDMPSWAKKYGEFVIRRREERTVEKDAARPILAMLQERDRALPPTLLAGNNEDYPHAT